MYPSPQADRDGVTASLFVAEHAPRAGATKRGQEDFHSMQSRSGLKVCPLVCVSLSLDNERVKSAPGLSLNCKKKFIEYIYIPLTTLTSRSSEAGHFQTFEAASIALWML